MRRRPTPGAVESLVYGAAGPANAAQALPDALLTIVRDIERFQPGSGRSGEPRPTFADLVEGPMKHHFPLVVCLKQKTEEDIAQIFEVTKVSR